MAAVTNVLSTSSADLEAELARARAQITRLQDEVKQSSGLRQRKGEATDPQAPKEPKDFVGTALGVQQPPAGGVPVQIVAGLCLLSFLLAYFFF